MPVDNGKDLTALDGMRLIGELLERSGIPKKQCRLRPRPQSRSGDREKQSWKLTLSDTGIVECARFLSEVSSPENRIRCTSLRIEKSEKHGYDRWNVELDIQVW